MEDKLGRVQDPGYNPGENLKQERRGQGADTTEIPPALWEQNGSLVSPAEQGSLCFRLREAKQLTWGLSWCHIEAICELPAWTGAARALGSAAGDSEGGEQRAVPRAHGTAGGVGRGHGGHQERALPVALLGHGWKGREQSQPGPCPSITCWATGLSALQETIRGKELQ